MYALTAEGWGTAPCYHVFVRMSDGRALDVLGAKTMDEIVEWARRVNPHLAVPITGYTQTDWATIRRLWGATVLSTYAPKRARRVAAELLASLDRTVSGEARKCTGPVGQLPTRNLARAREAA